MRKVERMRAELELKTATVNLKTEQEDWQSGYFDDRSEASKIPFTASESVPQILPQPESSPLKTLGALYTPFDVQNSNSALVDGGISTASVTSQSYTSSQYASYFLQCFLLR